MCKLSYGIVFMMLIMLFFMGCLATTKRNRKREAYVPKQLNKNCFENICNVTKSYPIKHLKNILQTTNEFNGYAGLVIEPYEENSVNSRWSLGEFKNMCKTKKYVMYPKAARNINSEWKFIVQVGNLTQKVYFETCSVQNNGRSKENQNCFASEFVPHDYVTSCQQQKVSVKLLALNSNGTLGVDHFPVPGSCVCTYAKLQVLD